MSDFEIESDGEGDFEETNNSHHDDQLQMPFQQRKQRLSLEEEPKAVVEVVMKMCMISILMQKHLLSRNLMMERPAVVQPRRHRKFPIRWEVEVEVEEED